MALESTILQAVRAAGEPIAILDLAIATGADTNDTGDMQRLRNALRGMVHKKQILSRNGLDGIIRYMPTATAKVSALTANDIDVVVTRKPHAVGTTESPAAVPVHRREDHVTTDPTPRDPTIDAAGLADALRGLHDKTVLVFHALRADEWVERGTLDFRTKMPSIEVRSALIALRKRGLVIAKGKTSNMLWARSASVVDAASIEQPTDDAVMEAGSDTLTLPKATPDVTPPAPSPVLPLVSRKKACYVGAPAIFSLELACKLVRASFPNMGLYLVGSTLERPDWRDVDLRMIMRDADFEAAFPGARPLACASWELDPKWLLLTTTISAWLSSQSGLPVDFQFQPMTYANQHHRGPRSAMGSLIQPTNGEAV